MTLALNLNVAKILNLALIGILFSFAYLAFVTHTFAQTIPSAKPDKAVRMELVQARRDAQKVKVCQVHEKNIKNRLSHLSDLVKNMMLKFDAITTRVDTRYNEKLLPAGKTISNYSSLITDIATKKTAVDAALVKANSNANNFSCDASADPKAELTQYRENMQAVKKTLQDYRKSIKNLIVAVATANGERLESPEPSSSPETTK